MLEKTIVSRLGDYRKFLAKIFLTKVAQILVHFLGNFGAEIGLLFSLTFGRTDTERNIFRKPKWGSVTY